ncbi:MAG: hypothetical protein KA149_02620 [Chitinophagales bacterium]|nr:hypothetical protein [Chitinophagales bacterium]
MKSKRYQPYIYGDTKAKAEGIKHYVPFIKERLKEFTGHDNLEWKQLNDGAIVLENSNIELIFIVDYRVYDAIGIYITNKKKKQCHSLLDIMERKGFRGHASYMSESEMNLLNSLDNPIKRLIYIFTTFINKHCKDIMSGDFSSVGEGSPTFD